ncbi:hypothetical protein [Nocardia salmonicida]
MYSTPASRAQHSRTAPLTTGYDTAAPALTDWIVGAVDRAK